MHVAMLVKEAGLDDPFLADALLAPLAPDLYMKVREDGATSEEISLSLERFASRSLTV
jgi:hypothetical protein